MLLDHRQAGEKGRDGEDQHRHQHRDGLFVGVLRVLAAGFAEEDDEKLAEDIKGGEAGGGGGEPAEERNIQDSPLDDEVFTEVAAGEGATGKSKHASDEANHRDGSFFAEATHVPHVGLVVHGDHDGTRREEEEALEAGVGEKMKHRLAGGRRDPDAENHVAELGNGGIGEDALDVILLSGHEGGTEAGNSTDPSNDLAGVGNDF